VHIIVSVCQFVANVGFKKNKIVWNRTVTCHIYICVYLTVEITFARNNRVNTQFKHLSENVRVTLHTYWTQ